MRMHFLIPTSIQLHGLLKSVLCPVFCVCVSLTALELRLKDGRHRCEGRVEVKHQGIWASVYAQYWFMEAAEVVCKELGCGLAIDAPRGSYFGPRLGPIWVFFVNCSNTEPESSFTIHNCVHSDFKNYNHTFSHDQDVGAVCSGKACLVWEGIPSRKSLSLIPRKTLDKRDHSL